MTNVDELAQIIRQVDGNHSLGASALAEAIIAKLPHLAARQPVGESVEEDVYCAIADMIEPYVQREGINPDGALPASVHDSVSILLEHWIKTRQQVGQEPVGFVLYEQQDKLVLFKGSWETDERWFWPEREQAQAAADRLHETHGFPKNYWLVTPVSAAAPAQAVGLEPVLAVIADALDCFSNPAVESVRDASYYGPASGADVVGAIAQGLAAVAARLREKAPPAQAVDLGQFRWSVDQAFLREDDAFQRGFITRVEYDKAQAERARLLALIDGKAVGNG